MRINIREKDGIAILDLEGNIDINAADFVETTGRILQDEAKDIICNFEGVNLIDYVGISLIAVVYKNVLNHKGRINIYNLPSHVVKLFSIVGMDRVFEYYATEEQAMTGIKESRTISQLLKKHLRRKFKRAPFSLTIEYKPKLPQNNAFYKGKIVNLSGDGVFMRADKTFSIGDALSIRLDLEPEPGNIELDAKVIWIIDKQMQPQDFPGMGLEFSGLKPQTQEKIIRFVEKHLARSTQK